jgi:hypothetical protein
MQRLRGLWLRLTGRSPAATAPQRPEPRIQRPAAPEPRDPGELRLVDGAPPRPGRRAGAAGFDPYSSDAGFAKPHSWERIDHD